MLPLLIVAILPPLGFLAYLVSADRREPEPLQMILYALLLGVISTFPAALAEAVLGSLPIFSMEGLAGAAAKSFFMIAPVEEACKLAVILMCVWKNRNFNEENDGIVYVTASAIGFALFENIFYVWSNGFGTGIARAFTSIPLHTFCGVIMGHYVGRARFAADRPSANRLILTGFLFAVAIHGLYDTFALSGTALGLLIVPLVIALFIIGKSLIASGKALSARRWENPESATQISIDTVDQAIARAVAKFGADKIGKTDDGRYYLKPERQLWKAIAARITFVALAAGWVLIALVTRGVAEESRALLAEALTYFSLMSLVPLMLGILLEVSYRRRKANNHFF